MGIDLDRQDADGVASFAALCAARGQSWPHTGPSKPTMPAPPHVRDRWLALGKVSVRFREQFAYLDKQSNNGTASGDRYTVAGSNRNGNGTR